MKLKRKVIGNKMKIAVRNEAGWKISLNMENVLDIIQNEMMVSEIKPP